MADTRGGDESPAWYMENHAQSVVSEFKNASDVGLGTGGGLYAVVNTVVPWWDSSGGYPSQTAYHGDKILRRVGVSDTEWGAWRAVPSESHTHTTAQVKGLDSALAGKADKTYVDSHTPQVQVVTALPASPTAGVVYLVTG